MHRNRKTYSLVVKLPVNKLRASTLKINVPVVNTIKNLGFHKHIHACHTMLQKIRVLFLTIPSLIAFETAVCFDFHIKYVRLRN